LVERILFDVLLNINLKEVTIGSGILQAWLFKPLSVFPIEFVDLMYEQFWHQFEDELLFDG